jgi:hypothetical protein
MLISIVGKSDCSKALARGKGRWSMSKSSFWWPTREEVLGRQQLMDRMMQLCGVDAAMAASVDGGLAFQEARTKCRFCRVEAACRLWLASDDGPKVPPDFCLNAKFFRSCTMDGRMSGHSVH